MSFSQSRVKLRKKRNYFGQLKEYVCGSCRCIMDAERSIEKPLSPKLFEYFGN